MSKKIETGFIIFLFASLIINIWTDIYDMNQKAKQAQQDIQACKDAGGIPMYDLCAEKGLKLIFLPGIKYAQEAYDYNK